MAADEVVMNVKSNIKQVTKETEDLSKSLEGVEKEFAEVNEVVGVQNDVIRKLETNLMNLKAQEEKMGKGSWQSSLAKMPQRIREATTELNKERDGLKTLKMEQKKASVEVKKFTDAQKNQKKQMEETYGSFRIFGLTLNGLKQAFGKIIPTIKMMFGSIKAGILSTGIGALLIAFGALMTYFTNSKKGADQLKVIMAALGAVVQVLKDLFSKVGEAIMDAFTNPKQAIADLWEAIKTNLLNRLTGIADAFVGLGKVVKAALDLDWDGVKDGAADLGTALVQIGTGMDAIQQKNFAGRLADITTEIIKETQAMMNLERATQSLRDREAQFLIEKAKTMKAIYEARLMSEDETLSAEDRVKALKESLELEKTMSANEVAMAKERVAIQVQQMALSQNTYEDELKLAQLRAKAIDMETASFKLKKRTVTAINSLEAEIEATKEAARLEKEAIEKEAADRKLSEAADLKALTDENFLMEIEDLKERALEKLRIEYEADLESIANHENFIEMKAALDQRYANGKEALEEKQLKFSEMTTEAQLGLASDALGSLSDIMGKESKAGKAAAIGQATIQTYLGATKAFSSLASIPVVGPVLGGIAAAGAIVAGFKNIQAIKSGGGGGKPSTPKTPDVSSPESVAPAQEMMSGKFDLGNIGDKPEPLKAFVVTDEMTNSQDQLAQIRNRATI